jgi:ribosomal-protein-alanine N-acetyltransferase
MSIVVRRARPGEGKALGAIGFAAWKASEFAMHDAGRADRAALLADFEKLGTEQPETILVAELDGRLAGWGAREDCNQYISDLWVAPEFQAGRRRRITRADAEAARDRRAGGGNRRFEPIPGRA